MRSRRWLSPQLATAADGQARPGPGSAADPGAGAAAEPAGGPAAELLPAGTAGQRSDAGAAQAAGPVPGQRPGPAGAAAPGELQVSDQLPTRIRLPADRLRCVIALTEICLLAGLGLLASATATGVNLTVVGASHHLPSALLRLIGLTGSLAFGLLPLALAVRLCVQRQFRRLAEALVTGAVAVGAAYLLNLLLTQPVPLLFRLHAALRAGGPAAGHAATVDGYLAGLVAYVTVIGLAGRPHWRTAFWTLIGFYAIASLAATQATVLALLITLAVGSAVGSGLRYAVGSISSRPAAADIAAGLAGVGLPLTAIRRVSNGGTEVRRYAATSSAGQRLDLTVFDRDQQAADLLYRLYRRLRLRSDVSRTAPLTMEGAVERQALLSYATQDAGVPTPRLAAVIRIGPDTSVLACEYRPGTTLADLPRPPTSGQLRQVWDTVLRLHRHRITHRALTSDRIVLAAPSGDGSDAGSGDGSGSGEVVLLEPGSGDVAATDLQIRLDIGQLVAETALLVGPDLAADLASEKVGAAGLVAVVPLLQPVALHRSTRAALRRRRDVLPALRKRLLAAAPDGEVGPAQLERVRPRTLITLIAGLVAAYLLAGRLPAVNFGSLLRHAHIGWTLAALAFSALTYAGASLSLRGFVLERLSLFRTFLVQVATTFVTVVTPPAVGGFALNMRYLRRSKIGATDAAASVGVTQVVSLLIYLVLVVIFAAIAGVSDTTALHRPPLWAFIALAAVAVAVLIVVLIPAGRRQLRARLASAAQVIPRLVDVALRPAKLAQGVGGTLLVSLGYILCLAASVRAFGGSAPLASIAVVCLTASAAGSVLPIPGGIGVVEGAMTSGLIAAGLPGGKALAAVLLYRTVTLWLPVPVGWVSLHFLQRREIL